jgi:hypothetical protein
MARPPGANPYGKLVLAIVTAAAVVGLVWFIDKVRILTNGGAGGAAQGQATGQAADQAVFLMPFPKDAPPTDGVKVWQNLLQGMVADRETRALLAKLYGGVTVELYADPDQKTAINVGDPNWKATLPEDGKPLVFLHMHTGPASAEGASKDGLRGTLDWGRLGRLTKVEPTAAFGPINQALGGSRQPEVDDYLAILLAANDYLLRHQAGWQLLDGRTTPVSKVEPLIGTAVERRVDLEREMTKYQERFPETGK